MDIYVVEEHFKASTNMFQEKPHSLDKVTACRNSVGAFQLLLYDGRTNHIVLDDQYSIPDRIDIPIYRVEIQSELPIHAQFVSYYIGNEDIYFADKLIEETSCTYEGDRMAPIYVEIPVSHEIKSGEYDVCISVYQSGITSQDICIERRNICVEVLPYTFPSSTVDSFHLDIWQQPSNLARTFSVTPWGDRHFALIEEMAKSLAVLGQKSITVIASEIPWKGWFQYIVKDYPANLYEYSMIPVRKQRDGTLVCDFHILDRYIRCFMDAGIDKEIHLFGLLGVWQPTFFPLVSSLDYPEKLVVRYKNEESQTFEFIEEKEDLQEYIRQICVHLKEEGLWEKVRVFSDEPKKHEVEQFKKSLAELRTVAGNIRVKVACDKEDVLQELLPFIDEPVTSYYCTCHHHESLSQSHPQRTQYYICNYPDRPNTFLHSPLLETRLQGTLAYYFKTDGLLRWAYNCWPKEAICDIRYNVTNLSIGDLCLVYPSASGHLLLSLRYKQLYRGIEDFYLLKEAEKIDKALTEGILLDLFGEVDTKKWMVDSHCSHPDIFVKMDDTFREYRQRLLALVMGKNDK